MFTEMLEIVFTPKIFVTPEIGGLGLSLFNLMENPRLLSTAAHFTNRMKL